MYVDTDSIILKLSLDFMLKMGYIITMMNDMTHIGCEEMISADDEARMEHERAEHEAEACERAEAWASMVAIHGPLMTDTAWAQYMAEYGEYMDMVWKD